MDRRSVLPHTTETHGYVALNLWLRNKTPDLSMSAHYLPWIWNSLLCLLIAPLDPTPSLPLWRHGGFILSQHG
jgi:hypothetical protein